MTGSGRLPSVMVTSSSWDPSTSACDRSGRGKPMCRAAVVAFLLRSCTTGEEKARTVPSGAVRKKFEMMRRLDGSVLVLSKGHTVKDVAVTRGGGGGGNNKMH